MTSILPYEGATEGRQLYREALLMQAAQQWQAKKYALSLNSVAKAREWPLNLGVGKPYDADVDTRLESYLEGLCYEGLKNPEQALRKWNEVIAFKPTQDNVNNLVTAMTLRKLSRHDEGEKLLSAWQQREPKNQVAKWCLEIYHGARPVAEMAGDENVRILEAIL